MDVVEWNARTRIVLTAGRNAMGWLTGRLLIVADMSLEQAEWQALEQGAGEVVTSGLLVQLNPC